MPVIISLGEILIDMVATSAGDSLFSVPAFEPKAGGAPANVAVGLARLGRDAEFIGKVGNDDFGKGLRNVLIQERVGVAGLITDDTLPTTVAMVALSEQGDPRFTFYALAHTQLRSDEIDLEHIRHAALLHTGSVMLAHEPARAAMLAAIDTAKDAGICCSYDMNWRPHLWPDAQAGMRIAAEPLERMDIWKMNASELARFSGTDDIAMGLSTLAPQAVLAVVTLGNDGCMVRFHGKVQRIAGLPGVTVVDTTGAGDAFMAALLAGLPADIRAMTEEQLPVIAQRANIAGALAVAQRGAIASLPKIDQLPPLIT